MKGKIRVAMVLLSLVCGLSLLDGCFRHRQQTVQRESMGYLRFTGHTSGARFRVEEQGGVVVWPSTPVRSHKKFATRPGTYVLTIERAEGPVLRRVIFLADDEITDVSVP